MIFHSTLNLSIKPPHVPQRRDGDTMGFGSREIDDMFVLRKYDDKPFRYSTGAKQTYSSSYLTLINIVTLKSGLGDIQSHWKWHHSKACIGLRFPIRLPYTVVTMTLSCII